MATGTYSPDPFIQFEDANGNPLGSGKLFTYMAGTSTPQATYSDVNLTIANPNPIVLSSDGRNPAGAIFLTPGQSYKFVLQDLNGNTISSRDNIAAVPPSSANDDVIGTVGQGVTAGQVVYLSSGDASKTAGLWYLADNTNQYSSVTKWVGIAPNAIASGNSGTIRKGGYVTGLSGLTPGAVYYVGLAGGLTSTAPSNGNTRPVGQADTASSLVMNADPPAPLVGPIITSPTINVEIISQSALFAGTCQGRLTVLSGSAVADGTGASSIYFTPYLGNNISLYDGVANWIMIPFVETQLALGTLTNALTYDVFAYNNAGTMALELLAWSTATVRATGLVLQNGVWVKSGATTRRYLGTFFTTASTTTEDSVLNRYVWNYYNRVRRPMVRTETTANWTYNTAAWRESNGGAGSNRLSIVVGIAETLLSLKAVSSASNNTADVMVDVGIGEDVTNSTVALGQAFHAGPSSTTIGTGWAMLDKYPAIGKHFYSWLEFGPGSNTTTWYGNGSGQQGITGFVEA